MRKLASIRRISDIKPIDGADKICTYQVDGWWVVDAINKYSIGDLCVYFEIDSFLPIRDEYEFLRKSSYRNVEGLGEGFRLRTIKLRKQVSQGLVVPVLDHKISDIKGNVIETGHQIRIFNKRDSEHSCGYQVVKEGDDVTDVLGVIKYEPPIPAQLAGQVRGYFPTEIIPKTDQERIQNCFDDLVDDVYEETLKLDGTSCTIFKFQGETRVCSRNLELKMNEANAGNTLVRMAQSDLIANMFSCDDVGPLAIQGELMGPGIQGNREKLSEHKFYVFDIYDIVAHEYLNPFERRAFCIEHGLDHVPVLNKMAELPVSVEAAIDYVDGLKSITHPVAEGVVYKSTFDASRSFKVISNRFLMKEKD